MAKSLTIEDLNVYYGDFHAVQDVSLKIAPKSVTAFIGPRAAESRRCCGP